MGQGDARRIFQEVEKSARESGAGVSLLHIVSGNDCFPPGEEVADVVSVCRALGVDVLFSEAGDRRMLVAGQVYDDVYAVALLSGDVPAVPAARYLQRRLAAESLAKPDEELLPASDATTLLKQWEWEVSLVFGRRFADGLLEKACAGHNRGCMTAEGLDWVRRRLIAATGGAIDFTEST